MTEIAKLRANAEITVQMLGPVSGLASFGFNRESLTWVEHFLDRQRHRARGDEEFVQGLLSNVGAYLGECIIACHGGKWSRQEQGWAIEVAPERYVFPFSKVSKLLHFGLESGESLVGLFDTSPALMIPGSFRSNDPG